MPALSETISAPTVLGEDSSEEPPRTCADVTAGDKRWHSIGHFESLIPELVSAAFAECGVPSGSRTLSIALLSSDEVRALNKAFRGKDYATNVLSFPAAPRPNGFPGNANPTFLGDVALSYETVIQEASDQRKTAFNHAAHLAVHGVLHLIGLDHEGDADAERMEAAERAILNKFGIPDPYAEDAAL